MMGASTRASGSGTCRAPLDHNSHRQSKHGKRMGGKYEGKNDIIIGGGGGSVLGDGSVTGR